MTAEAEARVMSEILSSLEKNQSLSRHAIRCGDPLMDAAHALASCSFISEQDELALRQIPDYTPEPDFLGDPPECPETGVLARCLRAVPVDSLGVKHCLNVMDRMDSCRDLLPSLSFYKKYLPRAVPVLGRFITRYGGVIPVESGYVYVMEPTQEGFDVVKIGKSITPDSRLKNVSPKMPFECEFRYVYPSHSMSLAEKLIHKKFAHLRTNGEWFRLAPELESWIQCEMKPFVKVAWIAQLREELWALPEVRIASIFNSQIAFDPYDRGWGAVEAFERFVEDEWI